MENKNILNIAIVLTIGVILAGSLLMPVISDATATEETIVNKGAFRMTDKDEGYTITYDPTNLAFIVGGESYPFSTLPEGRWTVATVDTLLFRFQNSATDQYQLFKVDDSSTSVVASSADTESKTWTFNEGTYTGSNGTTTASYSVGSFRGFDPTGDYVMTNGTDKAIVNGESSIIIGHGLTTVGSASIPFYIYGTVNDGVTVDTKDTITVSNTTINATGSSRLVDCYTLNSITFDATDGTNTTSATYDRVIVPAVITAPLINHLNSGEIALINTIPVMVIVALLMVAVGGLYLRRND